MMAAAHVTHMTALLGSVQVQTKVLSIELYRVEPSSCQRKGTRKMTVRKVLLVIAVIVAFGILLYYVDRSGVFRDYDMSLGG